MKSKKKDPSTPTAEQIEDMGCNLHTALRKCCDSPITSAAWNIVHVMPQEAWRSFLAAMVGSKTGADLKIRFHAWYEGTAQDVESSLSKADRHNDRSIAVTFRCILRVFDDDDWDGMAGFLEMDQENGPDY